MLTLVVETCSSKERSFVDSLIGTVPVNLKNEDAFHITIEEYLHALVNLTEELSRLALNAVTLGDYKRPMQISKFVKVSISPSTKMFEHQLTSLRHRRTFTLDFSF